jgi:voltage-gated potassium channel
VPAKVLGKIGTTVFMVVGLGIFAVAIHEFGQFTLQRRMAKRRQTRKDTADK